jgi:hypothetical protein
VFKLVPKFQSHSYETLNVIIDQYVPKEYETTALFQEIKMLFHINETVQEFNSRSCFDVVADDDDDDDLYQSSRNKFRFF